jgi:hypothetical protein
MKDYERELRRAARQRRKQVWPPRKANPASAHPEAKLKRAAGRRKKLKALGIQTEVCIGCASDDISTFELDHVAGRKHHDQLWPLCEECHMERTSMLSEQPRPTENPRNVFELIGRWLLGKGEYFELMIRYLRKFGEFLIELARRGYGDELILPA